MPRSVSPGSSCPGDTAAFDGEGARAGGARSSSTRRGHRGPLSREAAATGARPDPRGGGAWRMEATRAAAARGTGRIPTPGGGGARVRRRAVRRAATARSCTRGLGRDSPHRAREPDGRGARCRGLPARRPGPGADSRHRMGAAHEPIAGAGESAAAGSRGAKLPREAAETGAEQPPTPGVGGAGPIAGGCCRAEAPHEADAKGAGRIPAPDGARSRAIRAGGARTPAQRGTAGLLRREAAATGCGGLPATPGATADRSRSSRAQSPHLPLTASRREAAEKRARGAAPGFGDGRVTGRGGYGETDAALSRTCRPAPHSPAPSAAHTSAAAHPAPAP